VFESRRGHQQINDKTAKVTPLTVIAKEVWGILDLAAADFRLVTNGIRHGRSAARASWFKLGKAGKIISKKRESLPPGPLPPSRRAAFPSSLRAISLGSRLSERGECRAIMGRPMINLLRCRKVTPTWGAAKLGA
jgi:hypothetical protein